MSALDELVYLMSRLRAEDGCPWDRQQTHDTLKAYLVEEAYEVLDAIDRRDDEELKEELGDVMLQIAFHAQLAREKGRFDLDDVIRRIVDKIRQRHPHVFGDLEVHDPAEVLANWEQIKQDTREEHNKKRSILDGVPNPLPALLKARRVQEKVSRIGFDWEDLEDMLNKLDEELSEFRRACSGQNGGDMEEEFGDMLFSLVNVARFLGICPEDALRKTVNKFIARFKFIESELERTGRDLNTASLEEMDVFWEKAKRTL